MTVRGRRPWLLFVAPSLTFLVLFAIVPIVTAAVLSFYEWDLITDPEFIGLDNYRELTNDGEFHASIGHTLLFIFGYVPAVMIAGLALALLLNRRQRFLGLSRVVFFMPVVSAWVAVALIWTWMLNPRFGAINWVLESIGLDPPAWLFEEGWAMAAIIGVSVWKDAGFVMLLFLAGLQAIPDSYREAALVDGAGKVAAFRRVTLPLLSPTVFLVSIILLINSFQVFEQVWVMTEGGPVGSTTVIVQQIVKNAFGFGRLGYAAALSWVLFAMIFAVTLLQTRLQRRWVHYEV